jgi:hypothetical protein
VKSTFFTAQYLSYFITILSYCKNELHFPGEDVYNDAAVHSRGRNHRSSASLRGREDLLCMLLRQAEMLPAEDTGDPRDGRP